MIIAISYIDRVRFWEFVVPYFGLDESFQYTDDDIIEHLAAYDEEDEE